MDQGAIISSILFKYYKQESLSDGEVKTLKEWLQVSEENQRLFDELSNTKEWELMIKRIETSDQNPTWSVIQQKINAQKSVNIISFSRWKIAAVVGGLVVLACAGWVLWSNSSGSASQLLSRDSIHQGNNILPGNGSVQLVLENGKSFVIDSAESISILKEEQNISGVESGIITYKSDSGKSDIISLNKLITPIGKSVAVVLSDGSKVWLNALSAIEFPVRFEKGARKVKFYGEGYFEIAKDGRPFHVQTSRGTIEVLGTHFNVNDYLNELDMKTTLLEGKVKISSGFDSITLKEGEGAAIRAGEKIIVYAANTQAVTGWKNNVFWFNQASYEEIFKQLSRWYDLEIEFRHPISARFSGILPRDRPLSQLLNILEKGGQAHFEMKGKKLIVK